MYEVVIYGKQGEVLQIWQSTWDGVMSIMCSSQEAQKLTERGATHWELRLRKER